MSPELLHLNSENSKIVSEIKNRRMEIVGRLHDEITRKQALAILLFILQDKDKELSLYQLKEQLKDFDVRDIHKHLRIMKSLRLLESERKRKSRERTYYKLTKEGKQLLKDYYGITEKTLNKWINSVKQGNLEQLIEEKLGIAQV